MENKKLHILFLCSWYPNPDNKSNGIFIRRHALALSLQHQVTVVFLKSVEHATEKIELKTKEANLEEYVLFYPKSNFNVPIFHAAYKLWKFRSHYKNYLNALPNALRFDIIHVNTIFPAAIPALYALKKYPKASLFITEHWSGYYPEDGNYKGVFVKYITKKIVKKSRALFVISEKLKSAMEWHGLNSHYELVNNVVDTSVFKPIDNLKKETGTLQLLHVSSLVNREKNILGIIEITKELATKNISFHLTIVGYNEAEEIKYKQVIQEQNLNCYINFEGYKTPAEISTYMNKSDLFLLFSNFEGMPVVLLESIACGLPVITTPVGEVKKMIKPGMGIILTSHSIQECVENIINFKRQNFSDKENMYQYIKENYSMEAVSGSLTRLYQKYS